MLVLTDDVPHQLIVYDIKIIFGFAIIGAVDLEPGQSWVATELDDDGGLWGIVRDQSAGTTFELRHYTYNEVNELGVDQPYIYDPTRTIDITSYVGTEDDIFDLISLFELDKLYVFDADGGGSGGSGCINIFDISGSGQPTWVDSVYDIFSGDLDTHTGTR